MSRITLKAATVSPALDEPTPVVNIDLGHTFHANLSNCDFPVPGSPTNNICVSPRTLIPPLSVDVRRTPPAKPKATANFAVYNP